MKAPDGRIYAVYDSSDDEPMEDDTSEAYIEEDSASEAMRMSPLASPKAPDAELKEHLRDMMETEPIAEKPIPLIKKKKPQHPGVIVEDVSDSEEEDELKSVWRNRRPGPGDSWMEPIEAP